MSFVNKDRGVTTELALDAVRVTALHDTDDHRAGCGKFAIITDGGTRFNFFNGYNARLNG